MINWKKLWVLLLPLVLSGCMVSLSAEDLYALPKLPQVYEALSVRLTELLANGAEYAPPQAGGNLPPVQMVDINGDGSDEALAVYALEDLEPVQLMSTPYARYEIVDLDGDGEDELMVLRSDEAESGGSLADYYDWDSANNSFQLQSTARLSVPVGALQGMRVGNLQEGETAVFVTGREVGADETSREVTDILVYKAPELTNIVMSSDTGVSTQIFRNLNLQPTDINGDGAMEVPKPAQLLSDSVEEPYWKIYWHSYDIDGTDQLQAITYHNLTDSWYLMIPEAWDGHFTVRQNNASATVHSTTFYSVYARTAGDELLTIYTLTGTDREAQASKGGRTILRRQVKPDTVYAVTFGDAYDSWRYAVDPTVIADSFKVIVNRWSMGEN